VFGEATAVLAGDALLTLAFETVASAPNLSPAQITRAVRALAEAAGARGMVGGQIMDMAAEKEKPSLATLDRLQERKTGALIRVAAELGCIAASATEDEIKNALCYADGVGRAFQITDDILDVYGDTATLGKTVGSDAVEGKTTYMTYMTRKEAEEKASLLTTTAKKAILSYEGAGILLAFADMMLGREN
jgi:geranylgeranyl pyrophosphate synthase